MTVNTFVIFANDQSWKIGVRGENTDPFFVEVAVPSEGGHASLAQQISQNLTEQGYEGQALILAIPSSWCLCASVQTDDLPRKHRRAAMVYRLEEKFPIAAEDVCVDFVEGSQHALGVCVQTTQVAPIVESLEQLGVVVEQICPTTLLALQGWLTASDEAVQTDMAVWGYGDYLELFFLDNGVPIAWKTAHKHPKEVLLQLRIMAIEYGGALRIRVNQVDQEIIDRFASELGCQVVSTDHDTVQEMAVRSACDRSPESSAWINLRRDALDTGDSIRHIRQPLMAVIVTFVLFLAFLSGGMWWRSVQYGRIVDRYEVQQQALFRQLFPDQSVPTNIKSRIVSEHRRLASLRGETSQLATEKSSLLVLRDLLTNFPKGLRYRILELKLDGGRLYLEGQVRSHSDADAITASLNQMAWFEIEPPRTEKLADKGVGFTIIGMVALEEEGVQ